MTSPYASGGGGSQFETSVVAYYLASLLCEQSGLGVPGDILTSIRTQRGELGAPLDDIVLSGATEHGLATSLHLQVKNKVSFTAGDSNWTDVLRRAWDTFIVDDFDDARMRFGVAIGRYSARADDHYQPVLSWARYSDSADDFFLRIEKKDFSSEAKVTFVNTVRETLTTHAKRPITDVELWGFLKCLLILHFDFQNAESSRDFESVCDRLRSLFSDEPTTSASRLWDHLVAQAGRLVPAAGSLDRVALRARMLADGFSLAETSAARQHALLAIDQESRRALAEIKADLAGLRLHRQAASVAVRKAFDTARFIQLIGEPGTGKSALLKEFAEENARIGPIFVLKDARIQPRGWAAHAHILGISADCAEVLTDLAGAGEPLLFIDGIDKIVDPAVQITVNDILRTIVTTPHLAGWKVLVTVREQNLRHLETWIDDQVLKALPIASVMVTALGPDERDTVGAYFPRLRSLLGQGTIDIILHRPFFIDALLTLGDQRDADAELPATEVALLQLWWEFGGTDQVQFARAQEQRETLIALAERLARSPTTPILMGGLPADALERLATAGILRHIELGHSIVFAHDIFEEWALCETLVRHRSDIAAFLRTCGEPQDLVRPLQLMGTYFLETESTTEAWQKLIVETAAEDLRPVWQRAVLLSCLQSTRTTMLLNGLADYLLSADAQMLRKLFLALRTIEVVPNIQFLSTALTPDVDPADRPKYANLTAKPRVTVWVRFLDWLMHNVSALPRTIIPDLLPIFSAWQGLFAGHDIRHCREIGKLAGRWLPEVERDLHPDNFSDRRAPFGLKLSYEDEQKLEKSLRGIFLGSAAENPDLVSAYLTDKTQTKLRRRTYRDAIMEHAVPLAQHLPTPLVDFMLATFLGDPTDTDGDRFYSRTRSLIDNLGVDSDRYFYPASPAQPPFLLLLRLHESEGLRLIHGFCNHAIAIWRWGRTHLTQYEPATALPVSLSWEGPPREFWGDQQVYLWFRGTWGSHAVSCALMALELWALQQLDSGAPFNEVFDKVTKGNEAVAILGLAVSLCLAFPQASLAQSAPLVTCPHLWSWDIARWIGDRKPVNQMGDWYRYKHLLAANKTLNERPHRQREIRELLPYLIFSGDDDLQRRVLDGVSAFPEHLPFEYEEDKEDPDRAADLTEKMTTFAERGNLENWRVQQIRDGDGYLIWCDPPSMHTESFKALSKDHARLNEYFALGLWAQKTLDIGNVDPQITLEDAWRRAQAIDDDMAFSTRDGDFGEQQRDTAISGVAFVLARYSGDDAACAWALKTLERAAIAPEVPGKFMVRSALVSMHPKVFAVYGYSALLARERYTGLVQDALLQAALHPLEAIAEAVFTGMAIYAPKFPTFCWILVDMGIGRSIADDDHIPDHHNLVPDAFEQAALNALMRRARRHLARGKVPTLPAIPMPWVKQSLFSFTSIKRWAKSWRRAAFLSSPRRRYPTDCQGYHRNSQVFLWNVAEKLLLKTSPKALIADRADAQRVVELACQLRDFTLMEIVPPFALSRRDYRGDTPFEWVFACSAWLGKILAAVPDLEGKKRVLAPILEADDETALLMLQTIMRQFMLQALVTPVEIAQADLDLWRCLTDWVLAHPDGTDPLDGHLDSEYIKCVFSLLFCATADFSPLLCAIDPGWHNLSLFRSVVDRTVTQLGVNSHVFTAVTTLLNRGGRDWLPEPGLDWIERVVQARKAEVQFWDVHGENTVAILKTLVAAHGSELTQALRDKIVRLADMLVDSGVRGAGFLQQELLRPAL